MEMKVLATARWHHGIPDGEEKVSFVLPKFDIHNKKEAERIAQDLLVRYGAKNIERDDFFDNMLIFQADIGRFDKALPSEIKPFVNRCSVEIEFKYIWEYQNKVYELNEINEEIIHLENGNIN